LEPARQNGAIRRYAARHEGRRLEFLLLLFAGWVNRRQRDVIDYLKEEIRVLREHLDGRRLPRILPSPVLSPGKRNVLVS